MSLNIAVIFGSVRSERQGIKVAKFIENKLKERGHEVTLIDPSVKQFPLLDKMRKEYDEGQAPEPIESVGKILDNADSFVLVSAEYNHGIPPALKNLIDHFQGEYFFKPSAIVTYSAGPFGGVRVLTPLRAVVAELGMPAMSSSFPISGVQNSFDDEGNATDEAYDRRIGKFLDELEWYTRAFKAEREKGKPY